MRRWFAVFVAVDTLVVMVKGAVSWQFHAAAGVVHVALTLVLAILRYRYWPIVLVAAGLECVPGSAMLHACVAPLLFAAIATSALPAPEKLKLPKFIVALPPLVFLQIILGAAYRHKLLGVMWHMGGAMLVAGTILVACVLVLQKYPGHRTAVWMIAIVLTQVSLGITVFIMRLLDMDQSTSLAVVAATHICGGALTLTASARLALGGS